ncbi:AMP-binding protein, partial [Herbaspirillum sp.]|uniref:AMP-binding protein n=1 Tax=Herbaspirillum sp. TaxID=1890675 RepID=UPI0031E34174
MADIETFKQENRVFAPPAELVKHAAISGMEGYQALNARFERDYEGTWAQLARDNLKWQKPFSKTLDESNAPFYKWFEGGQLNVSYNCLDVNLENGNADKTAIIFEADDAKVTRVTYRELHRKVCQFANGLKSLGVKKGDRVVIYMPMSVEGVAAMQACARIGATHSVVFGGFSAKSLQERVIDAGAVAVITADYQVRGGKQLPLKSIVDEALAMGGCDSIRNVVVYKRAGAEINWVQGRDLWLHDVLAN